MPNPTQVPITPPRIPFINPETGYVAQPWYLFLLSLNQLTSGSNITLGDVQKGPPTLTIDEVNAVVDKASANLAPAQDGLVEQIAELQKQINDLEQQPASLLDQIAELQKQVESLALTPVPVRDRVSLSNDVDGVLPVVNGGTGQSTFVDGELLIGNSTGNTLTKAVLTAGANVTITNGAGAITIASTAPSPFGSPSSSGLSVATFSGTLPTGSAPSTNLWAQVTIGGTNYWLPIWAV